MHQDFIYEEKLIARGFIAIFGVLSAVMLLLLLYQILVGPFGDMPAPTVFFLIMFLFFLGLNINFSALRISMTYHLIMVGFGIIKKKIPLENIEDCFLDEASAISYGGFGIRMTRVKGKNRLAYITLGTPRCVLSLKEGKFRELAFSTKNPEEVMNVVKAQLAMKWSPS